MAVVVTQKEATSASIAIPWYLVTPKGSRGSAPTTVDVDLYATVAGGTVREETLLRTAIINM